MARVFILIGLAACAGLSACGAGGGSLPAAAYGTPLSQDKCQRSYRNENYAFGFEPPAGARGPDLSPPSGDAKILFVGTWTAPAGRQYVVTITNIGTTSFDSAIGTIRALSGLRGQPAFEDHPVALDSGRVGWLLKTGGNSGPSVMHLYDIRRGYLFSLEVDITGVTDDEQKVINAVAQSFCVDP